VKRIVIVGASLAGVTAADALRMQGHEGPITLLGEEPHAPYARPPLSKAVLAGREPPEAVMLPPLGDDVEVRVGARVAGLRLERRAVVLDGGEQVPFDGLVVATGARARSLARPGQRGEHLLRTLDDARALRDRLEGRPRVVVVGAGFLGMEVASTCRTLGLDVTVVDREPPLVRLLGDALARLVTAAAVDNGVRIEISRAGATLVGRDEIRGVELADGRVLDADLVVSAVGDLPNVEWLSGSGLAAAGGPLVVDRRCRVAPGVVAAGDVIAMRADDGTVGRTPHWASAVEQSHVAAAALLHGEAAAPLTPSPYFWTEQFGLEIKLCGRPPAAGSRPQVTDGSLAERRAVLQWIDDGRPVAAASVNHRMPVGKLKRLAAPAPAATAAIA